jgi:hypothetical protein
MGLLDWITLGILAGDQANKRKAAKKARTEPLVVETESLISDEMCWYEVWTEEERLDLSIDLTIEGPPVSVEIYTSMTFERRQRGDNADPIASKHDVTGDVDLGATVDDGQYTVVVYREDAPISQHDVSTEDGVTDYQIKIRFQ